MRTGTGSSAPSASRSGAAGAERLCALLSGERVSPLRQQLAVELIAHASSVACREPGAPQQARAGHQAGYGIGRHQSPGVT
jgi:hypothetical protein